LALSHHPLEYLRLVLEDEKMARQERTAKMLSTRAKFRSGASLEEWDHHHERGLTKTQFREIATLMFYQNRENLILVGSTGTGKTHLAIALGKKLPILILDDFGLRSYTHDEATILMDLLEERYQRGSVIVTSQVDPIGWGKLFEDPVIAEAITDRLTKPSRVLKFKGPSYRDKLKQKTH